MSKYTSFNRTAQPYSLSKVNIKYEDREIEKSNKLQNDDMDKMLEKLKTERNEQNDEFREGDVKYKGSSNPNEFMQLLNDEETKEKTKSDNDIILMLQQLGILY